MLGAMACEAEKTRRGKATGVLTEVSSLLRKLRRRGKMKGTKRSSLAAFHTNDCKMKHASSGRMWTTPKTVAPVHP